MQKIVGVRFRKAGKIYFFDPGDDIIEKGEFVIVDTSVWSKAFRKKSL